MILLDLITHSDCWLRDHIKEKKMKKRKHCDGAPQLSKPLESVSCAVQEMNPPRYLKALSRLTAVYLTAMQACDKRRFFFYVVIGTKRKKSARIFYGCR